MLGLTARKVIAYLLITVTSCLCAALLSHLELFQRSELAILDYHFRLRGHQKVDDRLSLILVDQYTVKKYGFPFSRGHYAIVANALANAGAKVVAFDYIFDQERPYDKVGDQMLVEVTSSNENTIHAWSANLSSKAFTKLTSPEIRIPSAIDLEVKTESGLYTTTGNVYLPYPDLLSASDSLGIISVVPGADGSIRLIPLLVKRGEQVYPSFALLIACRALGVSPAEVKPGESLLLKGNGREIEIPIDSKGQMLVNYTGDMMSLTDVRLSF